MRPRSAAAAAALTALAIAGCGGGGHRPAESAEVAAAQAGAAGGAGAPAVPSAVAAQKVVPPTAVQRRDIRMLAVAPRQRHGLVLRNFDARVYMAFRIGLLAPGSAGRALSFEHAIQSAALARRRGEAALRRARAGHASASVVATLRALIRTAGGVEAELRHREVPGASIEAIHRFAMRVGATTSTASRPAASPPLPPHPAIGKRHSSHSGAAGEYHGAGD